MNEKFIKCKNCGSKVDAQYKFCSACGDLLIKNDEIDFIVCPECNHRVDSTEPFCTNCGYIIKSVESEKSETIKCKNCGREVDAHSTFCTNCGKRLIKDERDFIVCPECNHKVDSTESFCTNCGYIIKSVESEKSETIKCKNCGRKVYPTDTFCTNCGKRLIKYDMDFIVCPECNHKIDSTEPFCTNCGAIIKTEETENYEQKVGKPNILVNITSNSGFVVGIWEKLNIKIINIGDGPAKNLYIDLSGPLEVGGCKPIKLLDGDGGEEKTIIGIKPKEPGNVPLDIKITYIDEENKNYEISEVAYLSVAKESETISLQQPPVINIGSYVGVDKSIKDSVVQRSKIERD
ncbi:MAG: zinc-ribbon domain-containing protein [Methanosarcinales archaeon]